MEFTCATDALKNALAWVGHHLPSRPPVPALAGVRLKVADGGLTLSTFNYEQAATAYVAVGMLPTDGEILVSGKMFTDIVRALPDGDATFKVDGPRLEIRGGRSVFRLATMPVDEYPTLPGSPPVIGRIGGTEFLQAVDEVHSAASRDLTLPILTGALVDFDPHARLITMMATDRYRLAAVKIAYEPAEGAVAQRLLLPAKVLHQFAKATVKDAVVTLGVEPDGSRFGVAAGGVSATSVTIGGEYPKVLSLFPHQFAARATVDVAQIREAVQRVALVLERNAPVRLSFTAATGEVLVEGGGAGSSDANDAAEVLEGKFEGDEDISIAFNPQFFLDGTAPVEGDLVISMTVATKPAVLTGAPEDVEEPGVNANYRYLIMPVRQAG